MCLSSVPGHNPRVKEPAAAVAESVLYSTCFAGSFRGTHDTRLKQASVNISRMMRPQIFAFCARFLAGFALLALTPSISLHAEKVEQLSPQGYVNDFAGVVDADARQKLAALCQEVDQKAGAQVAVVTIHSLEGDTVQD